MHKDSQFYNLAIETSRYRDLTEMEKGKTTISKKCAQIPNHGLGHHIAMSIGLSVHAHKS